MVAFVPSGVFQALTDISCSAAEISHFFKESWVLMVGKGVYEKVLSKPGLWKFLLIL